MIAFKKIRKFAENETFRCLIQPDSRDLLEDGYFNLKDHPVKGRWGEEISATTTP